MAYVVRLKRSAEKELTGLLSKTHDSVVKSLSSLMENPGRLSHGSFRDEKVTEFASVTIEFSM